MAPEALLGRTFIYALISRRKMALQVHCIVEKAQNLNNLPLLVKPNPEQDDMTPLSSLASDVKRQ